MKMKLSLLLLLTAIVFFGTVNEVWSQTYSIKIHSHNDYEQEVPFYEAYSQNVNSIEADVFLKNGELLVGHHEEFQTRFFIDILCRFFANRGSGYYLTHVF